MKQSTPGYDEVGGRAIPHASTLKHAHRAWHTLLGHEARIEDLRDFIKRRLLAFIDASDASVT